ncbi:MAG: glycosyltransferase [Candidatus Cloacimonadota bacterium]|nr:MAG: glycosyltransferase [Candidatus Cloacimonadota bacterium]
MIYPPINTEFFTVDKKVKKEPFFLIVSRLRPYKRIDIAIKAFNETKLPLLIIGEGSSKGALKRVANRNIQFLGKKTDEEIRAYYRRAQALIFPTFEDFGIVPLEACACGTPVIAFRQGGTTETIVEGKSGTFFSPQTSDALVETVIHFQAEDFKPDTVRKHALKFGTAEFINGLRRLIEDVTKQKKKPAM